MAEPEHHTNLSPQAARLHWAALKEQTVVSSVKGWDKQAQQLKEGISYLCQQDLNIKATEQKAPVLSLRAARPGLGYDFL